MSVIAKNSAHQIILFPNLQRAYYILFRKIYVSAKFEDDVKI